MPTGSRLVEFFAGSCAVWLNASFIRTLAADVSKDVVALYQNLQSRDESFIQRCRSFFTPENNTRENFPRLRGRFNASVEPAERGALPLHLNGYAYNGLVRCNAKGQYNVPFGSYAKPYFPLEELREFRRRARLTDTVFVCQDFRAAFAQLRPGDAVYRDPPYAPFLKPPISRPTRAEAQPSGAAGTGGAGATGRGQRRPGSAQQPQYAEHPRLYASAAIQAFTVRRTISDDSRRRVTAPKLLAAYF